ncbi:MAG: S8 family serine peptidase [Candidatus Polarisedimenticolia bacterium]
MPDPDSGLEKLDNNLFITLRAWEQERERLPDDGITCLLRFEGDLASIEALGFETHAVFDDEAMGVVRFKDISALVAHPGVLWMSTGGRPHATLDRAVPDIKARASSAAIASAPGTAGLGGDGLWHAVVASGQLTSVPDGTGTGVLVAILDTGIDVTHPMFMKSLNPPRTRIRRIWDQGLDPASLDDCPREDLLLPGGTYGVEFSAGDINIALNSTVAIAHKDCSGHGTHVAGIAAGGTLFPAVTGANASRVGVAPEAEIIAVKLLDVPDTIRFKLATGMGLEVDWRRRLRDAVIYCLRTAKELGKPVVINMSFGDTHKPGDGLDENSIFLDSLMDPGKPAGDLNFPKGAIIVKAAGNTGDMADSKVARIKVPAGGTIIVPLELKERRFGGPRHTWQNCATSLHHPDMVASFWYRRNFDKVKFSLRLPHQMLFNVDLGVGQKLEKKLQLNAGSPPSLTEVTSGGNVHRVVARHESNPSVPHPSGGTVRRHRFQLLVTPKVVGATVTYIEGIYEVLITAPGGTEIFFMGSEAGWGFGGSAFFTIATQRANPLDPLDPAVPAAITSEFSVVDTYGQHVITVGSYNHADHKIDSSSSRGPLRDFSDPPGSKPLIATKPELAAPGVDISSAEGVDTNVGTGVKVPPWTSGVRFTKKSGTSISAPMVTGIVALMLDKNAALNTTSVRNALIAAAANRKGVGLTGTAHDRAFGSGMADALESHK